MKKFQSGDVVLQDTAHDGLGNFISERLARKPVMRTRSPSAACLKVFRQISQGRRPFCWWEEFPSHPLDNTPQTPQLPHQSHQHIAPHRHLEPRILRLVQSPLSPRCTFTALPIAAAGPGTDVWRPISISVSTNTQGWKPRVHGRFSITP